MCVQRGRQRCDAWKREQGCSCNCAVPLPCPPGFMSTYMLGPQHVLSSGCPAPSMGASRPFTCVMNTPVKMTVLVEDAL